MATTLALQRFKLSSEEKKKRYGTFFRGGHFAPLTGGLAFWAHSSSCELLDLTTGARTDLEQAPGKYVRFAASSKSGDAVVVCDGDAFVRLSMGRDMNGNIEEVSVEKWSLAGKRLARAEERILSSKKLLGLAEQVMLTAELVLLNRELFVRL